MRVVRAQVGIAIALVVVFALAGAVSLGLDAATFDETAHVAAGLSYVERGDYRLNTEHPPLAKLWAAWPVVLLGRSTVDYGSPAWSGADPWVLGFEALNGARGSPERRDPLRQLLPARLAMLTLGVCLGGIVLAWSFELWGGRGALVSLFLFCLSPTMLAHARLVTTDLPAALGIVATLWTFWRFTRRPSLVRGALCGVAAGAALATKFSCLLLVPMLVACACVWIATAAPRERRSRLRASACAAAGIVLLSGLVVWAAYGFRFTASTDPGYALDWTVLDAEPGRLTGIVQAARHLRLAPEAWLHGLAEVRASASRRVAYLNGETSIVGFWYYFPEAFLLKTPPALLVLLAWAAVRAARRPNGRAQDVWAVIAPAAVYGAAALGAHLNLGHRHLVPLEPLLFVLLGGLVHPCASSRAARYALGAALVAYAGSFAAATPRYLSYFNALAGGPAGAPRYLLDSNLDWGQDLARLGAWARRNGDPVIHLAYFGTADPLAYGIHYRKVRMVHDFYPETPETWPGPGDLVAISVNLLNGLYVDEDESLGRELLRRRLVTTDVVAAWVRMRDVESRAGRRHPPLGEWLVERGVAPADALAAIREGLLPARIRRLRDTVKPLARIGDSIYLYRLPANLSQRETVAPLMGSHGGSDCETKTSLEERLEPVSS